MVGLMMVAFVYSYFWSASTIIYFLLRQSDDATDLDEVYLPDEQERDELLPLVGVAASDQPVVERPATGVDSDGAAESSSAVTSSAEENESESDEAS